MQAFATVTQFSKMLKNLDAWLGSAVEYATTKKFEPNVLADARLTADQYPLTKQIQSACDAAKFAAAYLTGQKAPPHPDTEKTIDELRARLKTTVSYLEGIKESDFGKWEERRVSPPWMHGNWVRGDEYLNEMAIPNFYFHIVTAYSILRHSNVDQLGKAAYIGSIPMKSE
jgi:uncharacterized protein